MKAAAQQSVQAQQRQQAAKPLANKPQPAAGAVQKPALKAPASRPLQQATKPQQAKPQAAAVKPAPAAAGSAVERLAAAAAAAKASLAGSPAAAAVHSRVAPAMQWVQARMPSLAAPATPAAVAKPLAAVQAAVREVHPTALAAAALAALAAVLGLGALALSSANDGEMEAEEALQFEDVGPAVPVHPTTTPAVGGRAVRRTRRQSVAVIEEAEEEGLPSVVAPRRRASVAATPGELQGAWACMQHCL